MWNNALGPWNPKDGGGWEGHPTDWGKTSFKSPSVWTMSKWPLHYVSIWLHWPWDHMISSRSLIGPPSLPPLETWTLAFIRPSRIYIALLLCNQVTRDTWHVTPDMWHLKRDTWHKRPDFFYLYRFHSFSLFVCLPVCFKLVSVFVSQYKINSHNWFESYSNFNEEKNVFLHT